ncbi:iron ABC transporter permease [Orbaceae bacterium ESL0727]|nr:iron ABC transporter permease [Orbaceae bacterium ESL0727]
MLIGLAILLVMLTFFAICVGAVPISWPLLSQTPFNQGVWQVLLSIRLPRIALTLLIGAALAVSGAIMQGLFRNPLADPGLLGVSTGASLAVAFAIILPFSLPAALALYGHVFAAFIGSLVIGLFIFSLSQPMHSSLTKLLLAGIAINALCGAMIGIISYLTNEQQLRELSLWSMGNLSHAQWPLVIGALLVIMPTLLLSFTMAKSLNLLQLGEEEAHYLGLNIKRTKCALLLLSALLIAVSVSLTGIIGFVGLVVPHLIRLQFGADHRWLLPGSALGGAILLLVADTIARTIVAPAEMPVGLLTSLLGGPYFLWLILRQKG